MVYVFFCVGGVLGPMRHASSVTMREGEVPPIRSLEADISLLARTVSNYPSAVIVVGNDWPLYYDLKCIRRACRELGQRVVNVVNTLGGTKEQAVLDFMSTRREPFVVLASPEFEFSELTAAQRVNLSIEGGFDETARITLTGHLRELGDFASRPLLDDDMLRATVGNYALRRARNFMLPIRGGDDWRFQRDLRLLIGQE